MAPIVALRVAGSPRTIGVSPASEFGLRSEAEPSERGDPVSREGCPRGSAADPSLAVELAPPGPH